MYSFTKKLQLLGNFVPRLPTGAPPLDGAGVPRHPVFFYVPPIIFEIDALASGLFQSKYIGAYRPLRRWYETV